MAETMVEIDYEVALLTVQTAGTTGSRVHFCEPIGHRQLDGDVLESWQPQVITPGALEAAKSIAARIVNALGGRGVYGVELLVKGDEVYFADVSPRPYDSGLVTLRSQRLSEFELHARAILGLPVDTIMITPGAAEVVYAGAHTGSADEGRTERATQALTDALTVPESDVRVFGYPQSYPRRRLGVALATAADVAIARERVRQVAEALRKFW
jgi:phosphoribosylglycinamide formyltransferase 2